MINRASLRRAGARSPWPALLFSTIAIAALALASSAQSSSPPPPLEIKIYAQDNGRRVQLHEGEILVIRLEANPSTGYGWEVERADLAAQGTPMLVQTGDEFLAPEPTGGPRNLEEAPPFPLLGAPTTQVLRFQAVREGKTSLSLAYRRPWEDLPPIDTFSIQVEAIGPFAQPPPQMVNTPQPTSELSVNLEAAGQLGLPAAFNWCDQGACTPVKDQGGCGSCWAFSTVAPLESNILYYDGTERDLSEQYLLSCNYDGWDCSGGFFAHDYHEWKIPPGEPDAGAVYEVEYPYTALDDPCNPPHTHYEKTINWEYVGNSSSIPSVDSIKQAIMDHGPVAVAICAGSAFRSYTGGVFLADNCTGVDHAVVLVGWDDDQGPNGIWYLRNSWGPGWGESGYMRIAYGVSNVGYAANYVVYQPTCYGLGSKTYPAGTGTVMADPPPDCDGGGYQPDTVVELTTLASPGWHFFTWGGDASGTGNPVAITMDSDKNITAHFMCDGCTRRHIYPLGMMGYEHD